MSNETHSPPPPAEAQLSTPKKAWSKPTISVIGETVEEMGSGPKSDPFQENATYGPTS